jgi:hypothetical protein
MHRLEQQIARTALQIALQMTIGRTMAMGLQGLGSILFPVGSGTAAGGGMAGNLPALHAEGGKIEAGGWGIIGERGFELAKALPGGGVAIFPHEMSKQLLPGFADGGMLSPAGRSIPYAASPGGAGNPAVSFNLKIENRNGSDVQASEPKPDGRGGFDVNVVIDRLKKEIKADAGNGGWDNVLGPRFGLRRFTPAIG